MNRNRWLWTAFALVAIAGAASGIVDRYGERHAQDGLTRALLTFAVARGLNGVISVAQGTEVALEPGGVGVNLTVGEILDPINDLIERFSGVMLVAASAIGLQHVLIGITGSLVGTAVLVATALFALACLWLPVLPGPNWRAFALRLFLFTFVLRFVVPLVSIGTSVVFDTFLEAEQVAATEALRTTSEQIEQISGADSAAPPGEDAGLMTRFGTLLDQSLDSINVGDRLRRLSERVANASEHVVNLIVIFVLQTILLPLGFIWLLLQAARSIAERTARIGQRGPAQS
jgi:hypothetical protein